MLREAGYTDVEVEETDHEIRFADIDQYWPGSVRTAAGS